MNDGELLSGDALLRRTAALPSGHIISADATQIASLDPSLIASLAGRLGDMLEDGSVILSCESWIDAADIFEKLGLLAHIGFDCEVVAFVRPQPDFLNASWWQWSAWTQVDFETWLYLSGFGNTCAWGRFLRSWSATRGVTSVRPHLLSNDIVGSFFDALNCDYEKTGRSNRSLPGVALRFLQRHRQLRPTMHSSEIDFVLERALGAWSEPAPWILPIDYVASFIEQCRPENENLLAMLTPDEQSAMLADRRWWDSASYRERTVVTPDVIEPDASEIDAFAAALATALQNAERELAKARIENRELQHRLASGRWLPINAPQK